MRNRWLALWLVLWASMFGAIAGCGGSSHQAGHLPKQSHASEQAPAGTVKVCSGLTDQCHAAQASVINHRATVTPFLGCNVPDVSDFQGFINWATTKPFICGAVDKAGEGGGTAGGSLFVHNWTQQRALGLWHAAYWFVRGSAGCSQAQVFIARLKSVGYASDRNAGPAMLDEEVPGSNLTGCLSAALKRAFPGHKVDVYTAPGTWPGGSHAGADGLWQAEYGRVLHPFFQPVVLWQCTDGVFGCVTRIPGIGFDDVSVNRGVVTQAAPPPPPPPPYPAKLMTSSENAVLKHYYGHHCAHSKLSPCAEDRYRAHYLAHNIWVAKAKDHKPWAFRNRGIRFHVLTVIESH